MCVCLEKPLVFLLLKSCRGRTMSRHPNLALKVREKVSMPEKRPRNSCVCAFAGADICVCLFRSVWMSADAFE